jgi:hypothetical protein
MTTARDERRVRHPAEHGKLTTCVLSLGQNAEYALIIITVRKSEKSWLDTQNLVEGLFHPLQLADDLFVSENREVCMRPVQSAVMSIE